MGARSAGYQNSQTNKHILSPISPSPLLASSTLCPQLVSIPCPHPQGRLRASTKGFTMAAQAVHGIQRENLNGSSLRAVWGSALKCLPMAGLAVSGLSGRPSGTRWILPPALLSEGRCWQSQGSLGRFSFLIS